MYSGFARNGRKRRLRALFFALLLPLLASCRTETPPAFFVDLQQFPLFLKPGFNPADTLAPALPAGNDGNGDAGNGEGWREIRHWTSVIVGRLPGGIRLPAMPRRAFLSPFGRPPQEWTFAIPFSVSARIPPLPALYLAAIGANWEIWLNGTRVRAEIHLDALGRITETHSERRVLVPLDDALLRQGENLLVFRILGDPTDQTVGFQYSGPCSLSDYEYLARVHGETLDFTLIGMYLLVGLCHFLLFPANRRAKYHLFGGIFSLGMGLYYLTRTRSVYALIPDTQTVVKLEFFFVFLMIPVLMVFAELLCRGRVSRVAKVYGAGIAFLALSQLLFPHPYGSDALILWQLLGIAAMPWILVHAILLPFAAELKTRGLRAALLDSYPGNLIPGVGIITLTIVADLLDSLLLHSSFEFTRFGLAAFVLSVAAMLARLYARNSRLLETLHPDPDAFREEMFRKHGLTDREKDVARLVLAGLNNAAIAARMFISESTVAFHVTGIFRKFNIDGKSGGRSAFLATFLPRQAPE